MNVLGHSGQSYDAWFTDYPSRLGEAEEQIARLTASVGQQL